MHCAGSEHIASAKRLAHFQLNQFELASDAPSLKILCPTRWTVRFSTLKSFELNLKPVITTLDEISEERSGTDASTKARGLLKQLEGFEFVFGLQLSLLIFGCTDHLSCSLQSPSLCIGDALVAADLATQSLKRSRCDEEFALIYDSAKEMCVNLDFDLPKLPRKRKAPTRLDDGSLPHSFETPEAYYRHMFYNCVDSCLNYVASYFDQSALQLYKATEMVLLSASSGKKFDDNLNIVLNHFGDDFDVEILSRQLISLQDLIPDADKVICTSVRDICRHLLVAGSVRNTCFSQVVILVKIYMLFPVTSATCERSFSALRRLKTYLRNTMGQSRLNHAAILHCHQDVVDELNIKELAKQFVSVNSQRVATFGLFT